eukprot:1158866-Pelagomonas_calceolata.AAC.4
MTSALLEAPLVVPFKATNLLHHAWVRRSPCDDPNAQPISDVEDFAHLNADTKTKGTQWGTGGMATKLTAGRIAVAAGCTMVVIKRAPSGAQGAWPQNWQQLALRWLQAVSW